MKVKVYVDAENLASNEITKCVGEVKAKESGLIEGRVYGNLDRSEIAQKLVTQQGFDFFETVGFSKGNHKTADVALIVDCMSDVYTDHEIEAVWILSKDCDFNPLITKLRGFHVRVEAPLLEGIRNVTVGDLGAALKKCNFDPMKSGIDAFYCQRKQIRELLDDEFSDELIEKFLLRKKANFLKGLRIVCDSRQIEVLESVQDFGFDQVVRVWTDDFKSLVRVAKLYTNKFYGLSFSDDENENYVSELREKCLNDFQSGGGF